MTAAVRRLYQNLRRSYNEAQLGKECYVESQSKQRKLRSRRQRVNTPFKGDIRLSVYSFHVITQVYDRRKRMVKDGEEANKWQSITCAYMTEESDDSSDPNVIITHRLPWRSESKSYQECLVIFSHRMEAQFSTVTSCPQP